LSYFALTILKSSGKREWYGVCALLNARELKREDYERQDETFTNLTSAAKSCPVYSGAAEKEFGRLCIARSELPGSAVCTTLALVKKSKHNGPSMSDIIRWIIGKLLGPFVPEPVPVPVEPAPRPKPRRC